MNQPTSEWQPQTLCHRMGRKFCDILSVTSDANFACAEVFNTWLTFHPSCSGICIVSSRIFLNLHAERTEAIKPRVSLWPGSTRRKPLSNPGQLKSRLTLYWSVCDATSTNDNEGPFGHRETREEDGLHRTICICMTDLAGWWTRHPFLQTQVPFPYTPERVFIRIVWAVPVIWAGILPSAFETVDLERKVKGFYLKWVCVKSSCERRYTADVGWCTWRSVSLFCPVRTCIIGLLWCPHPIPSFLFFCFSSCNSSLSISLSLSLSLSNPPP